MKLVEPRDPGADDGGVERESGVRAVGRLRDSCCFSHFFASCLLILAAARRGESQSCAPGVFLRERLGQGLERVWPSRCLELLGGDSAARRSGTDDRAEVSRVPEVSQAATDESIEVAFADQGHTDERAASATEPNDIELVVVKPPEPTKGLCGRSSYETVRRSGF